MGNQSLCDNGSTQWESEFELSEVPSGLTLGFLGALQHIKWLHCHGNSCWWLHSRLRSVCPVSKHCLLNDGSSWKCLFFFFLMDLSHFHTAGTQRDLVPPQVSFTLIGFFICERLYSLQSTFADFFTLIHSSALLANQKCLRGLVVFESPFLQGKNPLVWHLVHLLRATHALH